MERICLLDVAVSTCPEAREFLGQMRLTTIFHNDNADSILALAKKLNLPPKELSSYIWLKTYIDELAWSCDDVPSLEVVAQQFGVSLSDMEDYLQMSASRELEDEADFLEDIQEDAGHAMDGE